VRERKDLTQRALREERRELREELLLGGAAYAGEDAEFAEDYDVQIGALIVAGEIGFGGRRCSRG